MTNAALIDVSHIFRSCWHATVDQPVSAAFEYTVKTVLGIIQRRTYDHVIVCLDTPPYNRKNIFEGYKANRDAPDPLMIEQLKRVYSKFDAMGITMARAKGYEADDIIATLTKYAKKCSWKVDIFTNDKDLMQLIDNDVAIVSTRNGERYEAAYVKEKFGVPPGMLGDLLAIMGDTSDNIPGCPGVGQKIGAKMLLHYGGLEGVLAADDISGKLGAKITEYASQLLLSRVLVELQKDAPLVPSEIFESKAPKTDPSASTSALDAEFDEQSQPHSAPPEPDSAPTAGDMLIGGALAQQEVASGAIQAVAPPPPCAAKMTPVPAVPAAPLAKRESGPGLAKAQSTAGIELRPGLTLNADQFRLMEAMANRFHKGTMYQRKFDSVDAIFTIMELGMELGMAPQTALQNFHMIEGRPSMAAHLLVARAEADPNCEWIECTEETGTSVTYMTKKRRGSGRELSFTYTMKDAELAGMTSGGSGYNWKKRPREMLRKTAASQAARLWYPGACAGIYSAEEMGHIVDDNAA